MTELRDKPWHEQAIDIRLGQLGSMFVEREIEKEIHATFDQVREDRLHFKEPSNIMVIGDTGTGKSDIQARYIARNAPHRLPDGNLKRPVLLLEIRNMSTPATVARHMLKQLGVPEKLIRGATPELTALCKHHLIAQGVELVILDEFNNTLKDDGRITSHQVATWVKDLCKSKTRTSENPHGLLAENIPFAMCGTRRAGLVLDPATGADLASITPHRFEIFAYRYGTKVEQDEFRAFLDDLDAELPFDEFSGLGLATRAGSFAIADKIHLATHGFLRQLGYLVRGAGRLAIAEGADRIREHHLHASLESQRGLLQSSLLEDGHEGLTITNPFSAPLRPERERVVKKGFKGAA